MAERQAHGFKFEDKVKETLGIIDSAAYTAEWDIGDNTSVKYIAGTGSINMASVVRIVKALNNPGWTMILGRHDNKTCTKVSTIVFDKDTCETILGDLTLEQVQEFEEKIKSFPVGKHLEARAYAKNWKKENKGKTGLLTINPKIDSKSQRRVQCSINNTVLNKLFKVEQDARFTQLVGVNFG